MPKRSALKTGGVYPAPPSDNVDAKAGVPMPPASSRVVDKAAPFGKEIAIGHGEGILSAQAMDALQAIVEEYERTGLVDGKPPGPELLAIIQSMSASHEQAETMHGGEEGEVEGFCAGGRTGYAFGGVVDWIGNQVQGGPGSWFENPNIAKTRAQIAAMGNAPMGGSKAFDQGAFNADLARFRGQTAGANGIVNGYNAASPTPAAAQPSVRSNGHRYGIPSQSAMNVPNPGMNQGLTSQQTADMAMGRGRVGYPTGGGNLETGNPPPATPSDLEIDTTKPVLPKLKPGLWNQVRSGINELTGTGKIPPLPTGQQPILKSQPANTIPAASTTQSQPTPQAMPAQPAPTQQMGPVDMTGVDLGNGQYIRAIGANPQDDVRGHFMNNGQGGMSSAIDPAWTVGQGIDAVRANMAGGKYQTNGKNDGAAYVPQAAGGIPTSELLRSIHGGGLGYNLNTPSGPSLWEMDKLKWEAKKFPSRQSTMAYQDALTRRNAAEQGGRQFGLQNLQNQPGLEQTAQQARLGQDQLAAQLALGMPKAEGQKMENEFMKAVYSGDPNALKIKNVLGRKENQNGRFRIAQVDENGNKGFKIVDSQTAKNYTPDEANKLMDSEGGSAATGLPVQIKTEDDYRKLPSGAVYIDDNGNQRRKQ